MDLDDTIVAIATPLGRGGIGVVRLAGSKALAIAEPMLSRSPELQPGRALRCDLIDLLSGDQCGAGAPARETPDTNITRPANPPPNRIDEVVVTYFAKPHSYTTDDIIEI